MSVHAFALAVISLVPLPVENGEKLRLPNGPAPSFAIVSALDQTQGQVTVTVMQVSQVTIPVHVPEQVIVNGRPVFTTKTTFRMETRITETKIALKKAVLHNGAGKKVSEQDAIKQLKVGATVLLSPNGAPVDPLYLRALQPDTLILGTPNITSPQPLPPPVPPRDLPRKVK